MKEQIRLMADIAPSALFMKGGMIEYDYVPLTKELIERIKEWNKIYCGWLDWSDPGNSPEPPLEEQESFDKEGIEIWKQLIDELGDNYEVVYFGHKPNLDRHNFTSVDEYLEYCSMLDSKDQ
ncbi:MAG: hypothetical protein HC825_12335 [Oscillatoriales cyanobacterium RM1_1_9]|nr:hypothetical protein [Oscillatoriales cyanobacterium RM1_1_9]